MAAMYPTGYLAFVKVLEIMGGLLVAVPKTRNVGLLVLGPIVVNILAFKMFLANGVGLLDPPVVMITVLPLFLLWHERSSFFGLLKRTESESAQEAQPAGEVAPA